jgi:hypothetical protein
MAETGSPCLKLPRLTLRLALAGVLGTWLCLSSAAWGQTGVSTTRLASQHDAFTGPETGLEPLSRLEGQPQLERHLTRINRFRTLLHTGDGPSDHQDTRQPQSRPATATVLPRIDPAAKSDVTGLAILALEDARSARKYPSTFYPGVGLVFALKTISNWSDESMISALRAGAVPIYNQSGEVIGAEDPNTGRLLGGRRL